MRTLFLFTAFLLTVAAGQTPSFRTETRVVEITIAATRAPTILTLRDLVSIPITDLRASDLRLFDNGVEQSIASFENLTQAHSSHGPESKDRAANGRPRRLTVIVLDALNTDYSDQIYGHEGVAQMLKRQMAAKPPPDDPIAIFSFGDGLKLLHDFSTDYRSLLATVDAYDPERPTNWVRTFPGSFSERIRIRDTLEALTDIAQATRSYPGPKSLLWVSAAFPTQFTTAAGRAPVTELFHVEAARAMRKLGASEVVLYPISPEGLRGAMNGDSMMEMAEQTGGKAYMSDNDIGALVRAAMDDPREGYVLTFVPKNYQEDGSFHDLRLTTSRKGVDLRYRQGYLADPP